MMIRKIIFSLITLLIASPALAFDVTHALEKDYQLPWCSVNGGQAEYELPDKTRVDCLTPEYAVEFDYAHKWAESIGQSLYYSAMTGKKPAVVIILKKPSDALYLKKILKVDKSITVFYIQAYRDKK